MTEHEDKNLRWGFYTPDEIRDGKLKWLGPIIDKWIEEIRRKNET